MDTVEDKLTFLCGAIIAWSILFIFVHYNLELPSKLGSRRINDLKNRVVSIVHGLFALVVSGYHIYRDNPQYAEPATKIQHIILLTSGAYFLYDFFACIFFGLTDMGIMLHHGLCLVGIISCELTNNATTALIGLFLAEASNFPMHFRAILRTLKMRYTKLYEFSECAYIVTYIVARGILVSLLVITAAPVSETPIIIRFTCIGLWVQSLYFIYEMWGIMKRKIKNFNERFQKDISYNWFDDNARVTELSYYKNEGSDKIF